MDERRQDRLLSVDRLSPDRDFRRCVSGVLVCQIARGANQGETVLPPELPDPLRPLSSHPSVFATLPELAPDSIL